MFSSGPLTYVAAKRRHRERWLTDAIIRRSNSQEVNPKIRVAGRTSFILLLWWWNEKLISTCILYLFITLSHTPRWSFDIPLNNCVWSNLQTFVFQKYYMSTVRQYQCNTVFNALICLYNPMETFSLLNCINILTTDKF